MKPHSNGQYEGETLRGKIINTGGTEDTPDPIAMMDEDAPNTVINNLEPEEAELGQRVKLEIEKAMDRVMFGNIVEEDEKPKAKDVSGSDENYQVEFEVFGYFFKSETLGEEAAAEDLADFLAPKIGKEVRVERKR